MLIGQVLAARAVGNVLVTVLSTMTLALAAIDTLTATGPAHTVIRVVVLALVMFILGVAWWSGGISQQTRFALLAPQHRATALSLHFSAQFLGVAAGALGGLLLATTSPSIVPLAAAAIALAAITTVRHIPNLRQRPQARTQRAS